jgi:hypothetical protein
VDGTPVDGTILLAALLLLVLLHATVAVDRRAGRW